MFDTLVVGGGPAGLTAALHLAWHRRNVLVIDRRTGPLFFTIEQLFNVPGMPEVSGVDLQRTLRTQAESMGAQFVRSNVRRAECSEGEFRLQGEEGELWESRTVLLATGVARYHPTVDGDYKPCFKYAGKGNLCYCVDCEAPLFEHKKTVVIGVGSANGAAGTAMALNRYTDRISVLLTGGRELSGERAEELEKRGIDVREGEIAKLIGARSHLEAVELADGSRIEAEAFFVSSPARGRTDLAQQLGVEMAPTGHHAQPASQRGDTNVPGVWIAGDLRPMTQQVAVAMGTGNIAAVMIDQYLRKLELS